MSLIFGINSQVSFKDDAEKYRFIGYLAKSVVLFSGKITTNREHGVKKGEWHLLQLMSNCISQT